jgi:hypothetical protein
MTIAKWTARACLVGFGLISGVGCGSENGFGSGFTDPDGSAGGSAGDDGSPGSTGGGSNEDGGSSGTGGQMNADSSTGSDAGDSGGSGIVDAGGGCDSPSTYYADTDGDGFGDHNAALEACAQPEGYVENADDCYDGNEAAKPGQTEWFAVERGDGSFDYDCDGSGIERWQDEGSCGVIAVCGLAEGWEAPVPACGAEGTYILGCTPIAICTVTDSEMRTQECH